jgi:hypothetical protein
MSSYCKYCGRLVESSEMSMITSMSKHGDVWLTNTWIGCRGCAKGRLKNATG